ncbi:hypothetical protein N9A94_04670 [Akkermansiaceae bacterium]|nr:hypothetical protein [Akkermansiaceae bacterium]
MTTTTPLIIPRTKSPQGWIASAKTYRLILDDEALWAICIGRAMGMRVKSRDPLADMLAGKMINKIQARMEKQLAAAEDEITDVPLIGLLKRKHSLRVPLGEKGAVTFLQRNHQDPRLVIKSGGGKLKLDAHPDFADELKQIAKAFE